MNKKMLSKTLFWLIVINVLILSNVNMYSQWFESEFFSVGNQRFLTPWKGNITCFLYRIPDSPFLLFVRNG